MKRIAIIMEGGIVQNVLTDDEEMEVVVVDYDTEGVEEEEITQMFGDDSLAYNMPTEVNKKDIDYIWGQVFNKE